MATRSSLPWTRDELSLKSLIFGPCLYENGQKALAPGGFPPGALHLDLHYRLIFCTRHGLPPVVNPGYAPDIQTSTSAYQPICQVLPLR